MPEQHRRIRIAVVSARDPYDRTSWSGTMYFMMQALQRHCGDATALGPVQYRPFWARVRNQLSQRILGKRYDYIISMRAARHHARVFQHKLQQDEYDVIVAIDGNVETALLDTELPIVYVTSATQAIMTGYYPHFQNLLPCSQRDFEQVDRLIIRKAAQCIFPSTWAADSATRDFGADPQRVQIIPFGANIESAPSREDALNRRLTDTCRLLFLGKIWERKGGDIALEALIALERMGVPATLTISGCRPPKGVQHPRMHVLPYLDKRDEDQRRELEQLFFRYDLFLLPTRADTGPIVLCEANAYGLPVISTATGGVTGIIRQGENGYALPYDARGEAYAEVIAQLYQDESRYLAMVRASRDAFEERLNWDAWGRSVKAVLDTIISPSVQVD